MLDILEVRKLLDSFSLKLVEFLFFYGELVLLLGFLYDFIDVGKLVSGGVLVLDLLHLIGVFISITDGSLFCLTLLLKELKIKTISGSFESGTSDSIDEALDIFGKVR